MMTKRTFLTPSLAGICGPDFRFRSGYIQHLLLSTGSNSRRSWRRVNRRPLLEKARVISPPRIMVLGLPPAPSASGPRSRRGTGVTPRFWEHDDDYRTRRPDAGRSGPARGARPP